jgi:hypothetical protein
MSQPDYQGFVFQIGPGTHTLTISQENYSEFGVSTFSGTWNGHNIDGTIAANGAISFHGTQGSANPWNGTFNGTLYDYHPGYTDGFFYHEPTVDISGMAPFGAASGSGSEYGLTEVPLFHVPTVSLSSLAASF